MIVIKQPTKFIINVLRKAGELASFAWGCNEDGIFYANTGFECPISLIKQGFDIRSIETLPVIKYPGFYKNFPAELEPILSPGDSRIFGLNRKSPNFFYRPMTHEEVMDLDKYKAEGSIIPTKGQIWLGYEHKEADACHDRYYNNAFLKARKEYDDETVKSLLVANALINQNKGYFTVSKDGEVFEQVSERGSQFLYYYVNDYAISTNTIPNKLIGFRALEKDEEWNLPDTSDSQTQQSIVLEILSSNNFGYRPLLKNETAQSCFRNKSACIVSRSLGISSFILTSAPLPSLKKSYTRNIKV